jgi:hypothetical protein
MLSLTFLASIFVVVVVVVHAHDCMHDGLAHTRRHNEKFEKRDIVKRASFNYTVPSEYTPLRIKIDTFFLELRNDPEGYVLFGTFFFFFLNRNFFDCRLFAQRV